jgi:hypothetical protein
LIWQSIQIMVKVLWQKTNQTINTATAFENVTLTNGGYVGGITVQVTNFKPSPVPIGTATPLLSGSNNNNNSAILGPTTMNGKTPTDSVTFTASIVKWWYQLLSYIKIRGTLI